VARHHGERRDRRVPTGTGTPDSVGSNKDGGDVTIATALRSGGFVVTAELGPPARPDTDPVRETALALVGVVDAANVTDNQAATVKLSPLVSASVMIAEGLDPILQVTTRDRNLMAIQSDLLGAWALGVRAILALSGDPLSVGPYGEITKPVSDVDSTGLVRVICAMNEGKLAAGEELSEPTGFLVAAAANPFVDTIEKLEAKIAAGVGFFQTNIVYDVEGFSKWFAPVVAAGIPERAPFLVGVNPPRSTRMLEHMDAHIPGVEVDEATYAKMADLAGDEAKAAGIGVAVDVIRGLQGVKGVTGVHLMAPGWEREAVPRVTEQAGLHPSGRA
jgi:methylenetetrahydrofolate reductase (NADPH)